MAESGRESDGSASPFNSFTRRGPNKRKVKVPSKSQLLVFNFCQSDSEDDEDFVALSNKGSESSEASDAEVQVENNASSSESDDSNDDEFVIPEQDGVMKQEISYEEISSDNLSQNLLKTMNDKILRPENGPERTVSMHDDTSTRSTEILVCGVCLESESTEEDELVECDKCGITVHEGCYGDTDDSISETKSDSDAETEPWFCDTCKAKAEGICELCPNRGGILKETSTGRWVHLICALYVPGAGFRDVDKLETVVLEDISSSRWGNKRCMLCEDQRFSMTGICIECDAGLCKSYFHALCAQRHGLLSEIPDAGHLNDDDADPLYAHCTMHTDKKVMQARKHGWLAFQAHTKNFKLSDDPDEIARIDSAYARARKEYLESRKIIPENKLSSYEAPRLLSTCPEACEKLLKKSELLGYSAMSHASYDIYGHEEQQKRGAAVFQPNLSHGFVNHFFKREKWLKEFQEKETRFHDSIRRNQEEHKVLHDKWNNMKLQVRNLKSNKEEITVKINNLHSAIEKMLGMKLSLPSILKPKKKAKERLETSIEEIIHICATCDGTENQQKMALCDTCNNYYHIQCLDPPLVHLPRKGPNWIWQCTECDKSDSSEESVDMNESTGRRPKRVKNAPKKFTPIEDRKSSENDKGSHRRHRPCKVKRKAAMKIVKPDQNGSQHGINRGRKKAKIEEVFDDCNECLKEGNAKNMVRCDECSKCYHFDCCTPKVKSNPKLKGYLWLCVRCTDSDESSN